MTRKLSKVMLSLIYVTWSFVFLVLVSIVMFFVGCEGNNGFLVNPGPIGPYEQSIGRMSDYLIIPTGLIFVFVLLSLIVYPFMLGIDKVSIARRIWIISWEWLFLLCLSYVAVILIARMLVSP